MITQRTIGKHTGPLLPDGWGRDTLTKPAADLVRLAVWAGFPADVVARRVLLSGNKSEKINIRTVERVLAQLEDERNEAQDGP